MRYLVLAVALIVNLYSNGLYNTKYDKQIQSAVNYYWLDFPKWRHYKAQLYQESLLDSKAKSFAGAKGIAQFMPATWLDIQRELDMPRWATPYMPSYSIKAGAYYMRKLRDAWSWNRPMLEKHYLALASYNAGIGNVLKAQQECKRRGLYYLLWRDIKQCLPAITGRHSKETIEYIKRIDKHKRRIR